MHGGLGLLQNRQRTNSYCFPGIGLTSNNGVSNRTSPVSRRTPRDRENVSVPTQVPLAASIIDGDVFRFYESADVSLRTDRASGINEKVKFLSPERETRF